jgi:glyceraldehyde 3-phosphate dehydrogenase
MNIAINGFGRIGRLFTRVLLERGEDVTIVAVNDLTSAETLAYLFEYDSNYPNFEGAVAFSDNSITITQGDRYHTISVYAEKDPSQLPWGQLDIDLVVECTGRFLTSELAQAHLDAGAKKVLLSAPAKSDDIPTIVLGVNELDHTAPIISNASCTTNCIAPFIKAITDEYDISSISGVTVHAYTASQNIQDGPNKKVRTGRAAAMNIVPTTTGAASATVKVLPEIDGKLSISALRVPVSTGSYVYFTVTTESEISREGILATLESYHNTHPGILTIIDAPLVSTDINQLPYSTIVDREQLTVINSNQFEVGLWYDNEWGYSNRLVDTALALITHGR